MIESLVSQLGYCETCTGENKLCVDVPCWKVDGHTLCEFHAWGVIGASPKMLYWKDRYWKKQAEHDTALALLKDIASMSCPLAEGDSNLTCQKEEPRPEFWCGTCKAQAALSKGTK